MSCQLLIRTIIIGLVIVHSTTGYGQIPQAKEQAVRDLVSDYAQAREDRDTAAILRLFTPDADQLVSSGVWRQGRKSLVKGMIGSSRRNPGERSIVVERVRFLNDRTALADARYTIKGAAAGKDRQMWSTFVAVKRRDQWKLTAIRNMLPARPSSN